MQRSILLVCFALLASVSARVRLYWDEDYDGLHDGVEDALVDQFMPVFHFHEGERFFPTDVETFVSASRLMYRSPESGDCAMKKPEAESLPVLRPRPRPRYRAA